jgi:hypothetical protein
MPEVKVDRVTVQGGQLGNFSGFHIQTRQPQQQPEFPHRNARPPETPVSPCHHCLYSFLMGLTSLEPEIIHGMKFPFRGGDRIMCLGDLQPGCVEPDAAMAPLHDRMRVKTSEKSIAHRVAELYALWIQIKTDIDGIWLNQIVQDIPATENMQTRVTSQHFRW